MKFCKTMILATKAELINFCEQNRNSSVQQKTDDPIN